MKKITYESERCSMPAKTKRHVELAGLLLAIVGVAGAWLWVQASRAEPIAPDAPLASAASGDAYTFECVSITSGGGPLTDPATGADRGFAVVGQTAPGVMTGPGYTLEVGIVPCLFRATPGDFDGDGDADLGDFTFFQGCFNGPNRPYAQPAGCGNADFDTDADVDLTDFLAFQACFNGPNRAPACM